MFNLIYYLGLCFITELQHQGML